MPSRDHSSFQAKFVACCLARCALSLALFPALGMAAPLGMVSDNQSKLFSVFDANLDAITASLDAGAGQALGDCVIARDERLGVLSGSSAEITFVEFDPLDPGAAQHSERIGVSNLGVDMALSPDDRYLVLAGGGALHEPLSVVDTAQRTEVSTAAWFADHTSVEFCDNGTLLVSTINGMRFGGAPDNALYDASLDHAGQLALRGHRLSSGAQPNNSACAPGSLAGVLLDRDGGLTSFTLPEMEPAAYFDTGDTAALAATFSADGRSLYVRTADAVQTFDFNPVTGDLQLAWRQPAPGISTYFGIEPIALHPGGDKLYTNGGESLLILDSRSGLTSGAIALGGATGICLAAPTRAPVPGLLARQDELRPAP